MLQLTAWYTLTRARVSAPWKGSFPLSGADTLTRKHLSCPVPVRRLKCASGKRSQGRYRCYRRLCFLPGLSSRIASLSVSCISPGNLATKVPTGPTSAGPDLQLLLLARLGGAAVLFCAAPGEVTLSATTAAAGENPMPQSTGRGSPVLASSQRRS